MFNPAVVWWHLAEIRIHVKLLMFIGEISTIWCSIACAQVPCCLAHEIHNVQSIRDLYFPSDPKSNLEDPHDGVLMA